MRLSTILLIFFFCSCQLYSQGYIFISGNVIDSVTQKPIPYVHITVKNRGLGVVSNENGEFEIQIQEKYGQDSLLFSAIGYYSLNISITDISPKENFIACLQQRIYTIFETKVLGKKKKISPRIIVKRSIEKINKNYPFEPYQMKGYYRDYLKRESNYLNLLEAAIIIQDPGYQVNDSKSLIKVEQVRYNEDYKIDSSITRLYNNKKRLEGYRFPSYGGNEFTILRAHNPIRNYKDFSFSFINIFYKEFISNHIFKLDSLTYLDEYPVYCISYKYKRNVSIGAHRGATRRVDYNISGKIFIRADNYAIIKFIYTNNSIHPEICEGKLYELVLEYGEYKNKMYLNYISFLNFFEIISKSKLKGITEIKYSPFYQFREFFVNEIIPHDFAPLEEYEVFDPDRPLYRQEFKNDPSFWEKFNIIKPITELQTDNNSRFEVKNIITNRLTKKFQHYNLKFPQEKLYVHMDKNLYQPGDTIWFKAYTFLYPTNISSDLSNTLYTSLLDKEGNQILDNKFLLSKDGAYGDFFLPDTLEDGFYKMVAYTSWMKNFKPENVFTCDIEVRQIFNKDFFTKLYFDKTSYSPGDIIKFIVHTMASQKDPVAKARYSYELISGKEKIVKGKSKTAENGKDTIQFTLPESIKSYLLKLIITHSKKEIEKVYNIPSEVVDIDLQFFPEGGDMVEGLESRIAFKAIDEFGRTFDFKGELINENREIIKRIKTDYKGMGAFTLTPLINQSYYVQLTEPVRINKLFKLPEPESNGYVLKIDTVTENNIRLRIKSSRPDKQEHICIFVQIRGIKYWAAEGKITDEATMNIPTINMPAGIARITLFNAAQIPMAERLVFVNKHQKLSIRVETDKETYGPRERVIATIKTRDESGNPVPAQFSLAITDQELTVSPEIKNPNILSSVLLQSELKGDIPTPNFYFNETNPLAGRALDLVMMTHGWRRFSWDTFLKTDINALPEPIAFDMVSGKVYRTNGKPAGYANISITQLYPPEISEIQTDDQGSFKFDFQFTPENFNKVVLVAKSAKGRKNVRIELAEQSDDQFNSKLGKYFKSFRIMPSHYHFSDFYIKKPDLFLKPLDFDDTKLIPEVIIKAKKKAPVESIEAYHARTFGRYKKGEELNPNLPFEHWIIQINPRAVLDRHGNLIFEGPRYNWKGSPFTQTKLYNYGTPLLVLDGRYWSISFSDLRILEQDQIESIGTLSSSQAFVFYGERAKYGAIIVTTKKNYIRKVTLNENVAFLRFYVPTREFYSPKYETEQEKNSEIPDLRTTIFWEPNLVIDDTGEATVTFYNADRHCKIKGLVEGASNSGILGCTEFSYTVK